jgi:hypothetical protein
MILGFLASLATGLVTVALLFIAIKTILRYAKVILKAIAILFAVYLFGWIVLNVFIIRYVAHISIQF